MKVNFIITFASYNLHSYRALKDEFKPNWALKRNQNQEKVSHLVRQQSGKESHLGR